MPGEAECMQPSTFAWNPHAEAFVPQANVAAPQGYGQGAMQDALNLQLLELRRLFNCGIAVLDQLIWPHAAADYCTDLTLDFLLGTHDGEASNATDDVAASSSPTLDQLGTALRSDAADCAPYSTNTCLEETNFRGGDDFGDGFHSSFDDSMEPAALDCARSFQTNAGAGALAERAPESIKTSRKHEQATIADFLEMAVQARVRVPYTPDPYRQGPIASATFAVNESPMLMLDWAPPVADLGGCGTIGPMSCILWSDDFVQPGAGIRTLCCYGQLRCDLLKAVWALAQLAVFHPIFASSRIQTRSFGVKYAESNAAGTTVGRDLISCVSCCLCSSSLSVAVIDFGKADPPLILCARCHAHAGGRVILRLVDAHMLDLQSLVGNWEASSGYRVSVVRPPWHSGERLKGYLSVSLTKADVCYSLRLTKVGNIFKCGPATLEPDGSTENILLWTFENGGSCTWQRQHEEPDASSSEVPRGGTTAGLPAGTEARLRRRAQQQHTVTRAVQQGGTSRRKGKSKHSKPSRRSRHKDPLPASSRDSKK